MFKLKNIFVIFAVSIVLCDALCITCKAEQTPEELVADFYKWYSADYDTRIDQEFDDEIYNYVYACTVNKHRVNMEKGIVYSDYFAKGNALYYDLLKTLRVHKAVRITDEVSVVPVGFGDELPYMIVFVQRENDGWKIIKVEDEYIDY